MKIVEIIPQLGQGGGERFVVDLSNFLSTSHQVTLIVLNESNELTYFKHEISPAVKIYSLSKKKGLDLSIFFKLRNILILEKPDVVHTHLRAIIYLLFSFGLKTKFIHTIHSDAQKEAGDFFSRTLRRFLFKRKIVYPITISEESQLSFNNFYQCKSALIYNGSTDYKSKTDKEYKKIIDEYRNLKKDKNSLLIVNVARIQEAKNQLPLAKAIDSLNNKGYKIELAIIGQLQNQRIVGDLQTLNSPYVHLLGTRPVPRDYMKLSDAFCLSSIYEGMPITLIECFSVGAIPICTPVGGIKDMIVDGVNGLLSTGVSQHELEEMLIRFINLTEDEKTKMKIASHNSFEKFNMKICANKYTQLIQSL